MSHTQPPAICEKYHVSLPMCLWLQCAYYGPQEAVTGSAPVSLDMPDSLNFRVAASLEALVL